MAKLNFFDALERIADGRMVSRDDVQAAALRRRVWIAEWHIPGCLSESFDVCLTKGEAIESALLMAETSDGVPRGMNLTCSACEMPSRTGSRFSEVIGPVIQLMIGML